MKSSTTQTRTIAWCLLVVFSALLLIEAFVTRTLFSTLSAAVLTFICVKTSRCVPIPDVYQKRGITENLFFRTKRRHTARKKSSAPTYRSSNNHEHVSERQASHE